MNIQDKNYKLIAVLLCIFILSVFVPDETRVSEMQHTIFEVISLFSIALMFAIIVNEATKN
jgi:hypothetical protein